MTEEQENMINAKLAEIADAIPECRGAVFAISTGNDGEEGDVTVFKSAGGKELVNLFDFLTTVRAGLSKVLDTAAKEKLDKELEEVIGGGNKVS